MLRTNLLTSALLVVIILIQMMNGNFMYPIIKIMISIVEIKYLVKMMNILYKLLTSV